MIKSVTVTNHLGDSIKIELMRPNSSGFYIKSIEGLGPVKADVNVKERVTLDGGYYTSARANSRNIVINLGFLFSHDIEEIRHKSYKYFPLKKKVTLLIETDKRICETYGYVESNEPNIFTSEETTQISIICPDSNLYSAGEGGINSTIFYGIEPLFEFPMSNELPTSDIVNVFDFQTYVNPRSSAQSGYATIDFSNETISMVSTALQTSGQNHIYIAGPITLKPNTDYTWSCKSTGHGNLVVLLSDGTSYPSLPLKNPVVNFRTLDDGVVSSFIIYNGEDDSPTLANIFSEFMLVEGSVVPETYQPYESQSNIMFGEIKTDNSQTIFYSGEVEVGMYIRIRSLGDVSNITLYNTNTRGVMKIDTGRLKAMTGYEIVKGDEIVICTIKGEKSIYLIRNNEFINILNCLDKYTEWFQLSTGDNVFIYTADSGIENLQLTIDNKIAYEGV